jgi:hypothetical protein
MRSPPIENAALYGKPPWLWDTPTLSRIVQANGTALDNLRDLLEDADWHPAHAAWHASDLCDDPRWHQAMLLKQAEAAYLSRRMQEEEAFTAAIDLAELGWRLEQIWAWPSCYQRSLEAQTLAAQTLADLLRQTRLPEATLRQFQRQFNVCQPTTEILARAMSAFYVHEKKLILGPLSGELLDTMPGGVQMRRPGRLFFKPYETLQHFATAFRQLKEDAQAPLAHTSGVRLEKDAVAETSFQPNSAGITYFHQRMRAYTSMPAFLGLVRTRGNLIITLFSGASLHRGKEDAARHARAVAQLQLPARCAAGPLHRRPAAIQPHPRPDLVGGQRFEIHRRCAHRAADE